MQRNYQKHHKSHRFVPRVQLYCRTYNNNFQKSQRQMEEASFHKSMKYTYRRSLCLLDYKTRI